MSADLVPVDRIVKAAALLARVPADKLFAYHRGRSNPWARRAMFMARRLRPDLSYPAIGRLVGRNHATVLLAVRKTSRLLDRPHPGEVWQIDNLIDRLGLAYLPTVDRLARTKLVRALERAERECASIRAEIAALDAGGGRHDRAA